MTAARQGRAGSARADAGQAVAHAEAPADQQHELEGRAAVAPAAEFATRLVLFDRKVNEDLYWGRSSVRRAMLAMTPRDGGAALTVSAPAAPGDVFWGLQTPNGLTVALGVANYRDHVAARRHATAILSRAELLELHAVGDEQSGRSAIWVSLHGRVVIVSGRTWTRPQTSALGSLKRALRTSTLLHGAGLHHAPVKEKSAEPSPEGSVTSEPPDASRHLFHPPTSD